MLVVKQGMEPRFPGLQFSNLTMEPFFFSPFSSSLFTRALKPMLCSVYACNKVTVLLLAALQADFFHIQSHNLPTYPIK